MLKLSGVPVLVRDQSEFSQLMRAWLCKVREPSPAPDPAEIEQAINERQAFEASRKHACRINADTTRRARVDDAILAWARAAEGRQAPEKPPVKHDAAPEWARKWRDNDDPLLSVLVGAQSLARDSRLPQVERNMYRSLIPENTQLSFSTTDLIKAIPTEWLPTNKDGRPFAAATLSKELRRAYSKFMWVTGRTDNTHRETMRPFLERAVCEGLPIVRDGDAHEYVPDNVLRLVS